MIISHKHRFIFIKTRRTASTSMEYYLSQFCGEDDVITHDVGHVNAQNYEGRWNLLLELADAVEMAALCDRPPASRRLGVITWTLRDWRCGEQFRPHTPAYKAKRRVPKEIWDNYFKFCFVRNPWDQAVSHYLYHKWLFGLNISFKEYLDEHKLAVGNYHLYTDPLTDEVLVDFVGKYENLYEDFRKVCKEIGIPFEPDSFQALNQMKGKNRYREFYRECPECIEKVKELAKKEIELWGYKYA